MILFFDTETTGLPKNWKAPVTDLDNWPRLVQLAYLVYDFDGNLIHSCNEIIKPNGFTIPIDASKVHGITTDIANLRGSKIEDVFELFSIHLKRAKLLVAHNMAYDEKIISAELIRLGLENVIDNKEKICTMVSTVDLCKIKGSYGYKWPKLEELHRFLFKEDFEGAHDALADIQATAKCFWELKKNGGNYRLDNSEFNKKTAILNTAAVGSSVLAEKYTDRIADKLSNSVSASLTKKSFKIVKEMYDIPFLKIDEKGNSIWQLYNTEFDILHSYEFNEHYDIESKLTIRENDISLWQTDYCNYTMDISIYTTKDWKGWSLDKAQNLIYKNKIVLFWDELVHYSRNILSSTGGYAIFDSKAEDISKLIIDCQEGDEEGRAEAPYYQTVFYFNNLGKIFCENNYLKFNFRTDVPYLKIDKKSKTSWQFYNQDKKLFFGDTFENHHQVEKEIKSELIFETDYFWHTIYLPNYPGHLIELEQWKGWTTKENGDLFFNKNFKLNIFDLNLDISYKDGDRIFRFLNSNTNISKLITYCEEYHDDFTDGWYETLFYFNNKGEIFVSNNSQTNNYSFFDAFEALAEYEAEKNSQFDDFDRMH